MIEEFKNPDGTYNGIAFLSKLSGLPIGEVTWTANRIKQLMVAEGKSKELALSIVKEEQKSKPWLKGV